MGPLCLWQCLKLAAPKRDCLIIKINWKYGMYSWVQTKNVPPSYFNMYILHQYQGWEGFISFPSLVWKVLGRWECCKEVTLTLGGLTSTSSRIEQGSKLRRLICILKNHGFLTFRLIDYTDPYDIEYACFMLSKPPPLPQWQALTTPLQPPVCILFLFDHFCVATL